MSESFEDRLRRLGYVFEITDGGSDLTLKPARAKVVTGVLLILIGLALVWKITVPIAILHDIYFDIESDREFLPSLISSAMAIFGFIAIIRGFDRVLDFYGKRMTYQNGITTNVARKDIKLHAEVISNTTDFELDISGGKVSLNCLTGDNRSVQIVQESDCTECVGILKELNRQLKDRLKDD